jgi:hypothetical protein
VPDELEILKLRTQLRELGSPFDNSIRAASIVLRRSFCFRASGRSWRI